VTLVDQHMVPSEGTKDRISNLLSWDGLSPMRHLEQPNGAHVVLPLSAE
jgi:hypothetical protein